MICAYPNCEKSIKAKGLCSAHLSRKYRAEKASRSNRRSGYISSMICVLGRSHSGPVRVISTKNIEGHLLREKGAIRLFACFFLRQMDARVLIVDVQDKLSELGFQIDGSWFDIDAVNAIQVVRRCSRLRPIQVFRPYEYAAYAQSAKHDRTGQEVSHESWGLDKRSLESNSEWFGEGGPYNVWEDEERYAQLIERLIDSPDAI